ncbi:MAG: 1-deoxy-D-xylulose-5-phosphate reductoisomerase [Planctomycetes bacterium]|nr:1-deoxy-D-xylulose-5-phosphate reductoisomerase [Planctomycetota bacterium]
MSKNIAILGSTGSIGQNTLRVIDSLNSVGGERYEVLALTGHSNVELLASQVLKYKPKVAAITRVDLVDKLSELVGDSDVEILGGGGSLETVAQLDSVDTVVTAVVGAAGLGAVLAAAKKGKRLAIANKEPLVIAGELLMKAAKENGAEILPVDSEHSAIFQSLASGSLSEVEKIILTTSGGPFREKSLDEMADVTLEEALAHPTWEMGPKITIDSATMMNKALEVIEARWLFETEVSKIEVLVHPESIVHSLVEFVDGSVIAQLGTPDMCLPIQYALSYPRRVKGISHRLQLDELGKLTFAKPNVEVFRSLELGFEVARTGGTSAAVFNAANEQAVAEFLEGNIKFIDIVELIEDCLSRHSVKREVCLAELLEADSWARETVKETIKSKK